MAPPSRVQCTWSSWIDFDGLNVEDWEEIRRQGFDQWLDDVCAKQEATMPRKKKEETSGNTVGEIKGQKLLGVKFLEIAKANGDIVTYDQVKELCPKFPADPVAWARSLGAEVTTERKEKRYKVTKYV